MKTKVLLITPFLTLYEDDPAGISPPLGLAYLASSLESLNIPVKVFDIAAEGINQKKEVGKKIRYGLGEEEIITRIREEKPLIVGISCQSTLHAKDAHEVAKIVKKANLKILVVMGGAHPSAVPEEVLHDKNVDLVVRGEGEITFGEIVKSFSQKSDLSKIKGVSWKKGKRIIHNLQRSYIKDLDTIPFPARYLLPMAIYFREAAKSTSYTMGKKVMTMVTSRGCPGNCIYCAVKAVWGREWRGRSAKNVVDEIELLIKEYRADEVHFLDDSISVDKKRLESICDEIIRRKLKIKWTTPNGIAIWLLDKDLLLKMKKAGCYRLTFGLESGNKEILSNFIGKNYDYSKAKEMIRFASKIGLWTIGTFIVGFPFETREQINDTINFAVSTDLDMAVFYIANPFPGTKMYEIYEKEKLLPKEGAYEIVRGCKSINFSHEELTVFQQKATSVFLKSRLKKPSLLLRKLKTRENWPYIVKIGFCFIKMVFDNSKIKKIGINALWR